MFCRILKSKANNKLTIMAGGKYGKKNNIF